MVLISLQYALSMFHEVEFAWVDAQELPQTHTVTRLSPDV